MMKYIFPTAQDFNLSTRSPCYVCYMLNVIKMKQLQVL